MFQPNHHTIIGRSQEKIGDGDDGKGTILSILKMGELLNGNGKLYNKIYFVSSTCVSLDSFFISILENAVNNLFAHQTEHYL